MNPLIFLADDTTAAAGTFLGLGITGLIIALLLTLFSLWMLIDALTNPALNSAMKGVWAAIIFFGPFIGAVAYFFLGRRPKGRPSSA
ncbi:MAG: PLDc N-terminal domain-containing protein [Chthoniobacter sp.]|uniref:PLDc N-terminal domain-containing protein n=1 Tax=Chthoniobacter sp. TaxID=2510640 RepID=UPI0032AB4F65